MALHPSQYPRPACTGHALHKTTHCRSYLRSCFRCHVAQRADTGTSSIPAQIETLQNAPQEKGKLTFSWYDHWYPLSPLTGLDPKRPMHFDLLGMSLVVWSDSKGNWSCMSDRCPHRLAPLSEGRIEGDSLQCSYHGWRFSCNGACVQIPQIDDPKAHATAIASARSGVQALPTRVQHGLLWVLPHAAAGEVPFPSNLGHLDGTRFTWNVRDMPLRWDTVLENIMDPSHVPHAHHGVQGDRYQVSSFSMTPLEIDEQGFTVDMGAAPPPLDSLRIIGHWQPPYRYRVLLPGGPSFENWCIPTKPGWCRFMSSLPHPPTAPSIPKSLPELKKRLGVWFLKTFPTLDHLYRQQVLDGDAMILHLAERELFHKRRGDWRRNYYMPASADIQVSTFRRWYDTFGGQVPTCSQADMDAVAQPLPKEQVLDRWSQHTHTCAHCLAAVKVLDIAIPVCASLGLLAAAAAVASLVATASNFSAVHPFSCSDVNGKYISTPFSAALAIVMQVISLASKQISATGAAAAAVAVAFLLAFKALQRWRASYFYLGYDHATR